MFLGYLISLRGDIAWSPRSPDLTPCDLFSWGLSLFIRFEALKEAMINKTDAIWQFDATDKIRFYPDDHLFQL